jgi:carbon starvation protein
MLIECALAIIALIAAGILFKDGALSTLAPTAVFATGIATMIESFAGAASYNVAYALIILAVSVFCLTSLDTGTRLGRFMFTEFFLLGEENRTQLTGWKKVITNPYVSTLITVAIGGAMAIGGYAKIWPLFGSANQLLAGLALLAVAAWLGNIGKNNKMFMFPMAFMLIATITALIITLINNIKKLAAGTGTMSAEGLQILFGVLLVILAVNLAIEGIRTIRQKKNIQTAE